MLDLVEELGKRLKLLVSTLAALSRACQWVSQRSLSLSIDRTVRGMLCMSMNMNLSHESWLLFMPCLLAEKEIKTVYCFDALAEGICKVSILGELSAQPDSFLIILRSRSQETHGQLSLLRCAVCLYLFRRAPAVSDHFGSNQQTCQDWSFVSWCRWLGGF